MNIFGKTALFLAGKDKKFVVMSISSKNIEGKYVNTTIPVHFKGSNESVIKYLTKNKTALIDIKEGWLQTYCDKNDEVKISAFINKSSIIESQNREKKVEKEELPF